MREYSKLVPKAVLDAPYQLSMISLYDTNLNEIWHYAEDENSPQNYEKAQNFIRDLWKR